MIFSARNLLTVIQERQPYVFPIIPRRLPRVVVPGEHFVLKDLLFYEKVRQAGAKARQERLDQRKEKRQEGRLRKTLGEKGRASSSTACLPTKKNKKPSVKTTNALTPVPASPFASTLLASNSADSSVQAFKGNFDILDFKRSGSGACPSKSEPKPIAFKVINEPEEKEDMSTDLRAGFKERHHKRLHKAIDVVPPLAKRARPERVQEEPEREVPLMPVPPLDITRPNSAPVAEKEADPTPGGASDGATVAEEVLDQKDTSAFAPPPS